MILVEAFAKGKPCFEPHSLTTFPQTTVTTTYYKVYIKFINSDP